MLAAIGMLVLVSGTLAAVWITSWIDAVHQARHAADLAALAAAGAHLTGTDPCTAAARTARANRGAVVACTLSGSAESFGVTVRVTVPLAPHVPGGPTVVAADAMAGAGMR